MNPARSTTRGSFRSRLHRLVDTNHGGWAGWRRAMTTQCAYLAGAFDRFAEPALGGARRLVFVCLGNLNRSPFAADVAVQRGARAVSIGLQAAEGMTASARTRQRAASFGVDLLAHAPTDISEYDFEADDLLLVMETRHLHALVERGIPAGSIALLGQWASPQRLHLEDPQGRSDAYLATCFALIHSAVERLVDDLREAGSPSVR